MTESTKINCTMKYRHYFVHTNGTLQREILAKDVFSIAAKGYKFMRCIACMLHSASVVLAAVFVSVAYTPIHSTHSVSV